MDADRRPNRESNKQGLKIDRNLLNEAVATNDKQRFTISADGKMIRAAQGHSVAINLGIAPSEPPHTLFHGTARDNLPAIFAQGLKPGRRQHVHLSPNEETAIKVGSRHGKPVVLQIATARMHVDGFAFWKADNGVWLTEEVPPAYLGF